MKYSVVIPVLNGCSTLSVTLPKMLQTDRDDIEFVFSENHSDDKTEDLLRSFDDSRVRIFKPPKRLSAGQNLEFAYLQATGDWQGHLGDDDILIDQRFNFFDHAIEMYPDAGVLHTDYVRYVWDNYPNEEIAGTSSIIGHCDGSFCAHDGVDYAKNLLDRKNIDGGGAWTVSRKVLDQVRRRSGFFASPQNLEFFCMRAACVVSPRVVDIKTPLFVMGRHGASSGSLAQRPKSEVGTKKTWDWSFEDPNLFENSPYQYKGYVPISLDGAMKAAEIFANEFDHKKPNLATWHALALGDAMSYILSGRLAFREFWAVASKRTDARSVLLAFAVALRGAFLWLLPKTFKKILRRMLQTISTEKTSIFHEAVKPKGSIIDVVDRLDAPISDLWKHRPLK